MMKLTGQHIAALQAILDGRLDDVGTILWPLPLSEVHELGRACSGLAGGCKGVETLRNGLDMGPKRGGTTMNDAEKHPACSECGDADSVLNEQCLCPHCAARDAYQAALLQPAVDEEYARGCSSEKELPF